MGRLAAGSLSETITLTLPGPTIPDGRGGQKVGPIPGLSYIRAARVRVLRAAEKVRYGLALNVQAWELTTRATHPLEADPFTSAHRGRVRWKAEEGAVQSVEPDERREYLTILVTNQVGI